MNLYEFIDSPLKAKALEESGRALSAFEWACVIAGSKKATLCEKQAAWQALIDGMPNTSIKVWNRKSTLHDYLRELIGIQNEVLAEFYHRTHDLEYEQAARSVFGTTPGRYKIKYIYSDPTARKDRIYEPQATFSDYDACKDYINRDAGRAGYEKGDLIRYEIETAYNGQTRRIQTNTNFDVTAVWYYGSGAAYSQSRDYLLSYLSRFSIEDILEP